MNKNLCTPNMGHMVVRAVWDVEQAPHSEFWGVWLKNMVGIVQKLHERLNESPYMSTVQLELRQPGML